MVIKDLLQDIIETLSRFHYDGIGVSFYFVGLRLVVLQPLAQEKPSE
jgi:hypothetical protein